MNNLDYNVYAFTFCFVAYHCRELYSLHRSRLERNPKARFLETWLLLFSNKTVVKNAMKYALFSMGIFLGLEIAKTQLNRNSKKADTQQGENRVR